MLNSEQLLHFIWKNRLYNTESLITENGVMVEVIDPGLSNENAGPDFFNSKYVPEVKFGLVMLRFIVPLAIGRGMVTIKTKLIILSYFI